MTVKDRIADIQKRTGLSEDIIRRVIEGEIESIVDSLRHGDRATLIGRVTITPELRSKLNIGGNFEDKVRLVIKPAGSLESRLADLDGFDKRDDSDDDDIPEGVLLMQIPGLS